MSECAAGYAEHVDADVALAFADRALPEARRADVERRIDVCARCRAIIAEAARQTGMTTGEAGIPATRLERPGSPSDHVGLAGGERVGRYIVERPLGAGGMGVVSLARDPELHRAVVIKLVRPEASDVDMEARLRREAQAMAQLSHPNVVQIFDIGRHGDRVFLAMEFIAGQTLDAWLIEQRSIDEILAMFLQAGAGLEAAHRAGLLHRDFKPANVLVDRNGVAKVTDFGLARAFGDAGASMPKVSGVHAVLTHHDAVIGTPAYMAPEQRAGEPLDARTDQFALALALLDAITGQHPARRQVGIDATPSEIERALDDAPPRVRAAIARALSKAPGDRFPDLRAFLDELAPPKKKQRWWPLVAGLALCVAAVTTYLAMRREEACVAQTTWDRTRFETALMAEHRAFARWHADHVLGAIDNAVGEIGALEIADCQGKSIDAACLAARRQALAAPFVAAAPWAFVQGVASCSGEPATDAEALAQADALDASAHESIATGAFDRAAEDFVAEAATGDRAGDDSLRGRALLGRLELARMRGRLDDVRASINQLEGLLARHGNTPSDVIEVVVPAARALIEVGDVNAAFAMLDRADRVARSPDERLGVNALRAWAMHAGRLEFANAKQLLDEALARDGTSPAARAAAWNVAGELALERGESTDGFARGAALDPAQADAIGEARAAGSVDALPAPGEPAHALRVAIARAQILYAKAQYAAAGDVIAEALKSREPVGISAYERVRAVLLQCDIELAKGATRFCYRPDAFETFHKQSPLVARYELQFLRQYELQNLQLYVSLDNAIEIHEANHADPLYVAELRLKYIRLDPTQLDFRKSVKIARDTFAAAGRTAEVAELDAIMRDWDAKHPYSQSVDPEPIDAGGIPRDAPSGDPWN